MSIIILAIGFAVLIKSADFLVSGASALAKRLGVSDLAIGLTVVAFGTSMPELFVNIFASAQGSAEIAIGNVVGSNIFNILVILGIASIIYPLSVPKGTVWKEIPFSLLAVFVLGVLANDMMFDKYATSMLTRTDGYIFLSFFVVFLCYAAVISGYSSASRREGTRPENILRPLLMLFGGIAGLGLGGRMVVDSAVAIAATLGVSQSLIGLTIVAAGTSLPELATSAVAAYRKNADIAVGNIVGSNVFNVLFILGISSLIKPLPIASGINIDMMVLTAASLILFFFMFTGRRRIIDRWEGVMFLIVFSGYIFYIVKRG